MDRAQPDDDGVRWLALALLRAVLGIANDIRHHYGLKRGEKCPRCGHGF